MILVLASALIFLGFVIYNVAVNGCVFFPACVTDKTVFWIDFVLNVFLLRSLDMGLDGSKEEEDAAKLIQNKFRDLKIRKKSKENLLENTKTVVVSVNGIDKGEDKF